MKKMNRSQSSYRQAKTLPSEAYEDRLMNKYPLLHYMNKNQLINSKFIDCKYIERFLKCSQYIIQFTNIFFVESQFSKCYFIDRQLFDRLLIHSLLGVKKLTKKFVSFSFQAKSSYSLSSYIGGRHIST